MTPDKIQQVIIQVEEILPKIESKISNINEGGCGVFAYLLWKRLKEIGIESVKAWPIIYNFTTPDEVNTAFLNIALGENPLYVSCNFSHIILEINSPESKLTYLIDSEGIEETTSIYEGAEVEGHFLYGLNTEANIFGEPIEFELLEKLALDERRGLWNTDFNRDDIPVIEKMINRIQPV